MSAVPNDGYVTADDGVRLFFRQVGSGSQIVLIPNGFHLFDDFARLADTRRLVFYDVRNRGRSDTVADASKISRGIHHDVDDIDAVRRHFRLERVDVIAHSYVGVPVALYAMRRPDCVGRVVLLGPMPPDPSQSYAPHLTNNDDVLRSALARLGELERERAILNEEEFCRKFWSILTPIYVADPADAARLSWSRCDLPNERAFRKPWMEHILPSINQLRLTDADFASARAPFLVVHGTRDRSAPYGGGRDWAMRLPDARLVTIPGAAHAPWIEQPARVFDSISTFLDGAWPPAAEIVRALDG